MLGLKLFLTGRVAEVSGLGGGFFWGALQLTVISYIVLIFFAAVIRLLLGEGEESRDFRSIIENGWLTKIFVFSFLEELFARGLFLGILTKIPFLSGPVGFYVLFLVGNSLWALSHIGNYQPRDRQILRVLPQFLVGMLFTVAYVQFGLMGSVCVHISTNLVGFSIARLSALRVERAKITKLAF